MIATKVRNILKKEDIKKDWQYCSGNYIPAFAEIRILRVSDQACGFFLIL